MKALKLLLLTLFAALGLAAQAQTIEVYKDGQVIDTFPAAQVDSVVYKQVAATPKYYYYVGWEEISESNLATLGHEITNFTTASKGETLVSSEEWTVTSSVRGKCYIVVPEGTAIYDNSLKINTNYTVDGVERTFALDGINYLVVPLGNSKTAGTAVYLVKI